MISWVDSIQFRFKLDTDMINILLDHGYDSDTYFMSISFMWPTESDLLFTSMADFRAGLLHSIAQEDNTTSCHLTTKSCADPHTSLRCAREPLVSWIGHLGKSQVR